MPTGSLWILSWNCWKAPADDSTTDNGLIWLMFYLFSLPSGVLSTTVLSFTIAAILWSKVYAGSKGPLWWSFPNTNWPTLRSEALVAFLSFVGFVTLFFLSNLVCSFHSFPAPALLFAWVGHQDIYSNFVSYWVCLLGGLYHVLGRMVTQGHPWMVLLTLPISYLNKSS